MGSPIPAILECEPSWCGPCAKRKYHNAHEARRLNRRMPNRIRVYGCPQDRYAVHIANADKRGPND